MIKEIVTARSFVGVAESDQKRPSLFARQLLQRTAMLTIFAGLAQPALAQQTQSGSNQSNDEIIVTATKRSTNLQTTSGAISVVGVEEIEARHLGGADDYL